MGEGSVIERERARGALGLSVREGAAWSVSYVFESSQQELSTLERTSQPSVDTSGVSTHLIALLKNPLHFVIETVLA